MNYRTFEIFDTDEAYVSWDKHIEHVDVMDGLTVEQKDHAKEAFRYLRLPEVLGERFLEHARDAGHPLFRNFTNTAPWTRKWLARFAGAMKNLREADGFSACMKEEIKDASKFAERESVLEVAYKLFNAGFDVSFDPNVTVFRPRGFTGRHVATQAAPDLKIFDKETGEEIIVEVSALGESDKSKQSARTYHTVSRVLVDYALHREYLFPRARIHRILDDKELKVLEGQLRELIDEVKNSGQVCYLINDEIEACLAPAHSKDVPDKWGEERGIEAIPIEGPSIPLRDPLRTRRAVRREQRQLPADKPGMLVITTDRSLLFHAHGLMTITSEVDEAVLAFPKVSCAVVTCTYQAGDKEGFMFSDERHTIIKRITDEGSIEQTIISLNPSRASQILSSTLDKVRRAFTQG